MGESGKFLQHLDKFNALSKISQGSILNAITDPTLQIIGIDEAKDRKLIIDHIAMLKSRTAMMKKSQSKFNGMKRMRKTKSVSFSPHHHNKSANGQQQQQQYGLDDLAMQQMLRSVSKQSESSDNLCVIC